MIAARYRHLFEQAFRSRATGFLLAHNHPSGDPRPSAQDIVATRKLGALSRALDLEFLDHIVIGGRVAVSMRRSGLMR